MNTNDIKAIKSGDLITFKKGFVNKGSKATFIRIVQDGRCGPKAPTVEYSFAGQIKQTSHDHFTK